jgi:hypothetical protein
MELTKNLLLTHLKIKEESGNQNYGDWSSAGFEHGGVY